MTGVAARWLARSKPRIKSVLLRLLLAQLLVAGWAALEIHAVRIETAAKASEAALTARAQVDDLLYRVSAAAGQLRLADASDGNGRIALTATMLHLERGLEPARSLFLYDARGRFVAATLPLLPGEEDISHNAWFRAIANDPQPGGMTLIVGVHAPLGNDEGVIIARTVADRSGAFAGVAGTFVDWSAFRTLLDPASLPPGSDVRVVHGAEALPVLGFPVGARTPHTWLDTALSWLPGASNVSVTTALPGGFVWHATAPVLSEWSAAKGGVTLWGGPLLLAGLLATFLLHRGTRPKHLTEPKQASRTAPRLEPDWLWELDADRRLIGVAGNAPPALVAAIGANFLDLVAGDPRSRGLREAIARRAPVQNLELILALPDAQGGSRRRVVLNGRAVQSTGGFWGTAAEIRASPGWEWKAPDCAGSRVSRYAQARAASASSPSRRPSSVLPSLRASALR